MDSNIEDSRSKEYDQSELRGYDLCAGIGGFRVASKAARVDVDFTGYCEIDKYARQGYEHAYDVSGEHALHDLREVTREKKDAPLKTDPKTTSERRQRLRKSLPDFDIIFSGFPCQSHSLMGNRRGKNDPRGNIFFDIKEIIAAKQPEYFILENVRSIKSVNNGRLYEEIVSSLQSDLEYNLNVWTLNAADYGVPQTRRRVFFVGSRNHSIPESSPPEVDRSNRNYLTSWHALDRDVDRKYFLSDKILETILKDKHKGYNRKAEINLLTARPLCKTMHKMHRASQDNYYSEPFIHGSYNEDAGEVKMNQTAGDGIRRLTPRESYRLQGFPEPLIDDILNSGLSDTRLYMLAGNAVPPPLAKEVLDHALSSDSHDDHTRVRRSRQLSFRRGS